MAPPRPRAPSVGGRVELVSPLLLERGRPRRRHWIAAPTSSSCRPAPSVPSLWFVYDPRPDLAGAARRVGSTSSTARGAGQPGRGRGLVPGSAGRLRAPRSASTAPRTSRSATRSRSGGSSGPLLRRAAGVHTCNAEAGRILRAKGFSGADPRPRPRRRRRPFAPGTNRPASEPRPAGGRRAPTGVRRTTLRVGYVGRLESHKGVDGPHRGGGGDAGRRRSRSWATDPSETDLAALVDRVSGVARPGRASAASRTRATWPRSTDASTWWSSRRSRRRRGSSSSGGSRSRPWRRAWSWSRPAAARCPRWSATPACSWRQATHDALAEALAELRDDPPSRARRAARRGRRRAAATFDWPNVARRHARVLPPARLVRRPMSPPHPRPGRRRRRHPQLGRCTWPLARAPPRPRPRQSWSTTRRRRLGRPWPGATGATVIANPVNAGFAGRRQPRRGEGSADLVPLPATPTPRSARTGSAHGRGSLETPEAGRRLSAARRPRRRDQRVAWPLPSTGSGLDRGPSAWKWSPERPEAHTADARSSWSAPASWCGGRRSRRSAGSTRGSGSTARRPTSVGAWLDAGWASRVEPIGASPRHVGGASAEGIEAARLRALPAWSRALRRQDGPAGARSCRCGWPSASGSASADWRPARPGRRALPPASRWLAWAGRCVSMPRSVLARQPGDQGRRRRPGGVLARSRGTTCGGATSSSSASCSAADPNRRVLFVEPAWDVRHERRHLSGRRRAPGLRPLEADGRIVRLEPRQAVASRARAVRRSQPASPDPAGRRRPGIRAPRPLDQRPEPRRTGRGHAAGRPPTT